VIGTETTPAFLIMNELATANMALLPRVNVTCHTDFPPDSGAIVWRYPGGLQHVFNRGR
jgi:hypothetical protein